MARRAHEPERTCVGCRTSAPKATLLRFAREEQGAVVADPAARMSGRGVYVHREPGCVERALAGGAGPLVRALRAKADPDAAARLRREIEGELQA